MPETTLADVLASVKDLGTETRTRVEALASDSRARDTAQTERSTRLEERLTTTVGSLQNGLTTLSGEMNEIKTALPRIEKQAQEADVISHAAITSFEQLEESHQKRWQDVMGSNEKILKRLDEQDADRDQIELQKKLDAQARLEREAEERKRESMAAKRVQDEKDKEIARKVAADEAAAKAKAAADVLAADEREKIRVHDENRRKNRMTAIQTIVIAAMTSGSAYLGVRASHQDTSARLDSISQTQSAMSRRVETVAVAVAASAEPGSSPALSVAPSLTSPFAASPSAPATGVAVMTSPVPPAIRRAPYPVLPAAPAATAAAAPPQATSR